MNRLNYVDGMRGIFALAVATSHFNKHLLVPGAYLAVDFFFVLSGFILTRVYLPRMGRITLGGFAFARFSRLWPLHAFTMLLYVIIYMVSVYLAKGVIDVHPNWRGNDFRTFIENLLLIHNLGFQEKLTWNYPSWSISVEFYVNFVLFLVLSGLVVKASRARIFVVLGATIFICMSILNQNLDGLNGQDAIGTQWAYFLNAGTLRGFAGIFLGVLVASIVAFFDDHSEIRFSTSALIVKSLLECALMGVLFYIMVFSPDGPLDFIAAYLFALLLTLLSIGAFSPIRRMWGLKPLTFLGMISYGVYLCHAPLLQFFKRWDSIVGEGWSKWEVAGIYLVTVMIVATALHYWVEQPAQGALRNFWKGLEEKKRKLGQSAD